MRLFAERIARKQPRRRLTSTDDVAGGQPRVRDAGQGVLVKIGESLAIRGEAFVAEALDKIPVVERERLIGVGRPVGDERLEGRHVEINSRLASNADRVLADLENDVRVDPRRCQAAPDEPQGLAQGRCRRPIEVRPEVCSDGVAEARPWFQGEERGERLSVATGESDRDAAGVNLEPPQEADRQRWHSPGLIHHRPHVTDRTPGPSPRGPDARGVGRSKAPQPRPSPHRVPPAAARSPERAADGRIMVGYRTLR